MARFPSSNQRPSGDSPHEDGPEVVFDLGALDPGDVDDVDDPTDPDDAGASDPGDGAADAPPAVIRPDATHDRRVIELRSVLAEMQRPERCELMASATRPACPASIVVDAVHDLQSWSAEALRDAMSVAEAADDLRPSGATGASGSSAAEAVIVSVAHGRRERCAAAWERLRPLVVAAADDPALRAALVDRITATTLVHRRVTAAQVGRAVDDAFDVIADGPEVPGLWSVDVSVAAVTRLVTAAALQFLLAPDAGLARSMLRSGRLGGPVAESTVAGEIGPLARRSDGALVTRPFRSGGVVVIGPPGVGKTALLKAVLASFRGAIVVSTNKPWDLQDVVATRLDASVVSMDPSCSPVLHPMVQPVRVDPVAPLTSLRAALAVAEVMVKAQNPMGSGGRDRFFLDHAERLAGALLWWAKLQGHDAATAAGALSDLGRVTRELRTERRGREALDIVRSIASITDVTRSGIIAQTAQVMKAWSVQRHGWERLARLDPDALIRSSGTLLLCSDAQGAGDDNVVITAALDQMVTTRFAMAQRGESVPPLLLLLDECANTAPHHLVPSWTSTGPGRGVNTMLLFQDVSNQMVRVWGHGGAEIVNNAASRIVYPGVTDPILRQQLNGLAVAPSLGVNTVDVVASASMPAPPPEPGTVYVVDESARLEVGTQVRFHEEVGLVWAAVEANLRHDPSIVRAVNALARRIEWSVDQHSAPEPDASVIEGMSGRDTP